MAKKICPFCQEDNKEDAIMCRFCNKMIENFPSLKKCVTCAKPIPGPEDYCEECGQKAKADTKPLVAAVVSVLVVVAVLAIIGFVIYIFNQIKNEP
jgi:predicted nucleic acid-binding Zn ribbon protein